MTHQEAREVLADLKVSGQAAHRSGDYRLRNEIFALHDSLALALLHGRELPEAIPGRPRKEDGKPPCPYRALAAA